MVPATTLVLLLLKLVRPVFGECHESIFYCPLSQRWPADFTSSGQYYGIAAAVGKIGAFAGSYALDALQKAAGDDEIAAGRNPFFVASSLAFLAAGLVLLLPHIGQDTIDQEDIKFREYLMANGYDTSKMGLESISGVGSDTEIVNGHESSEPEKATH